MKKLLGIVVLSLLWCLSAHSELISKDKSVNYYLEDQKYKIHSTNQQDGAIFYHMWGHKKNTHRLITCVYDPKSYSTICWKP